MADGKAGLGDRERLRRCIQITLAHPIANATNKATHTAQNQPNGATIAPNTATKAERPNRPLV
jgi:hypothetical protein